MSEHPRQRPMLALALRVLAVALLAAMNMLIKLTAQRGVTLPETMFWRHLMTLPIMAGWLAATGRLDLLKTSRFAVHARRGVMGFMGMVCNFGAVILLPLAITAVIGFTAPIFGVLLSAIILREKVGPWRWGAVVMGFAGILLVYHPSGAGDALLGILIGLMGSLMIALVSLQVRDLGRTEQPGTIVFHFSLVCVLLIAPIVPFFFRHHDPQTWGLLAAMGLIATLGQLALTAALRLGTVASVMVMDYSNLFFAAFWGWQVFGELPPPTTWLGAPLVIAAGLIIVWREHTRHREPVVTAISSGGES